MDMIFTYNSSSKSDATAVGFHGDIVWSPQLFECTWKWFVCSRVRVMTIRMAILSGKMKIQKRMEWSTPYSDKAAPKSLNLLLNHLPSIWKQQFWGYTQYTPCYVMPRPWPWPCEITEFGWILDHSPGPHWIHWALATPQPTSAAAHSRPR